MKRFTQLAIAAAAIALMAGCQQADPSDTAAAAPAQAESNPQAAAAQRAAEPVQQATAPNLSAIIRVDTIGATKAFVERTLGQSTYETEQEANYQIDGCAVSLSLAGNSVNAVSIALAPGCRFDMSGLVGSEQPVPVEGPITFARFETLFGQARYTAPCLTLCGNAYDPYLDAVVGGSHANGFVDIAAHVLFVEDGALDAAAAWREQLTAVAGEDFVTSTGFNCDPRHDGIARQAFSTANVEMLRFGRELGTWDCP